MNILNYFSAFLLIFIIACGSHDSKIVENTNEKTVDAPPIANAINFPNIDKQKTLTIPCKADSNVSYTLYVPTNYNTNEAIPIILFFDSYAEGKLPIAKYSYLADAFNIVIAASNNSKNGNSIDENMRYGSTILNDLKTKININNKRIYTSGFSGGSRVAAGMAIFKGGINSVIGIGAGLPNLEKQIENHFNYIGISGIYDFNYTEMVKLDSMFSNTGIDNALLIYDGKHEWPPLTVMQDAFTWLEFKAVKQMLAQKNDTLIQHFITRKLKIIADVKKKNSREAYYQARLLLNYTNKVEKVEQLPAIIAEIEKSTDYKNEIKKAENLKIAERIFKDQYLNALAVKDVSWWKTEVPRLNKLCKQKSKAEAAMIQRTLGFLSLACYMNTQQTIKAGQIYEAEHYAQIYKAVDPTNAEAPYLLCNIYLALNKNTEALSELKQAIKIGFKDFERAKMDLNALNAPKELMELLK